MDNPTPEEISYADIRRTIRSVVLPLVQAIYDENPSDIILFCSDYFNHLKQKKETVLENIDHKNLTCVGEPIQRKEDVRSLNVYEKLEETENFPTNIRSASDTLLTTDKKSEIVNVRVTSSWDTPSKVTEPVESLEILKDTICGIGDQSSSAESQIGLENDVKAGDINTSLKNDSAFEDDECANDLTDEDHLLNKVDDLKSLCTKFDVLEILGTRKLVESGIKRSDQDIVQRKDINECKKQLSPSSSFGFIPYLNASDSEEEARKMNSGSSDGEDFKSKNQKNCVMKVSEAFNNFADAISHTETNFNLKIQNAKEISDVIERRNDEKVKNSCIEPDQISGITDNPVEDTNIGKNAKNLEKCDQHGIKDDNIAQDGKTNDHDINLEADDEKMTGCLDLNKKYKEGPERKIDFTKKRNSRYEQFPDEESTFFIGDDDDDDDEDDHIESQNVDNLWRKRRYETHQSADTYNGVQRRGSRLQGTDISSQSSNFGDVTSHRFHNAAASDPTHCPLKNQTASESSTGIREFSPPGFISKEISQSNEGNLPYQSLSERKISSGKISNANPQSIPYSWRKLRKQSHSKESQTKLSDEAINSLNCEREVSTSTMKETETKKTETGVNEPEEIFFEASDGIHNNAKLGIEEPKVKTSKREDDANGKSVSDNLTNDQSSKIGCTQRKTLSETDISTYSNNESQSEEYFYNQDGHGVIEIGENPQNGKQNTTEGTTEVEANGFAHDDGLLTAQKDKAANQHSGGYPLKEELKLNAACGDFVPLKSDANERNVDSDGKKNANITKVRIDESTGEISKEFVEEVIAVITEQQKKDSFDDLNFSCYSENDSSNVESSDYSETEEFNINDSMENI